MHDFSLSLSCALSFARAPVTGETTLSDTACSVEDETRNAELNGNRNPEWWGDFSQLQI